MRPVIKYHETDLKSALARALSEHPETTVDLMDVDLLRRVVRDFRTNLDERIKIIYAVKANPGRPLPILKEEGIDGFACSSGGELDLVLDLFKSPDPFSDENPKPTMFYDYPQPTHADISEALKKGARSFVVQSRGGVEKVLKAKSELSVPEAVDVACRILTPFSGAEIHLAEKFGASSEEAGQILRHVLSHSDQGLRPGLVMHPGSQCHNPSAYADGISRMVEIATSVGGVDVMNFGGGMPVNPRPGTPPDSVKSLQVISEAARELVFGSKGVLRKGADCYVEPGRSLAAPAIDMFIPITGIKEREDGRHLFLAESIYTIGIDDPVNNWGYTFIPTDGNGKAIKGEKMQEYFLWGRSCDSGDLFSQYKNGARIKSFLLPAGLKEGDLLHYSRAGAYSHESIMSRFCALPVPVRINYNDSRGK